MTGPAGPDATASAGAAVPPGAPGATAVLDASVGPAETGSDTARVLVRGTRVRAGNAMERTRVVLLDAACRLVADRGTRRTSMTDIARAAGIAKGTLYNHFRSKDDVFAALAESEVLLLAEECRGSGLADALTHAVWRVGTHPAVRRVAAEEPAVLAALYTSAPDAAGWRAARRVVAAFLAEAGRDPDAADLLVRWIATHAAAPDRADAVTGARLLAAALPPAPAGRESAPA